MANTIKTEMTNNVATITLTEPQSLSVAGKHELLEAIKSFADNNEIRALIVAQGHPEAFLVNIADLAEMTPTEAAEYSRAGQQIALALAELPFPTIAAVDGTALGGGCELAMSCDLTYASDRSHLGQIEAKGGVMPAFGGTWNLAHRVGFQKACEMIFTGAVVDAATAKSLGIVLEVLPSAEILPHCQKIATEIAGNARLSIAKAKKVLREGYALPLAAALAMENGAFASLFGTPDQRNRMKAVLAQSNKG